MHTPGTDCDHKFRALNNAVDLDLDYHAVSRVNDRIDLLIRHGHVQAWVESASGLSYHVTFYVNGTWASECPEALTQRQRRVLDRIAPALGNSSVWVGKTPHHIIIDTGAYVDKRTTRMIADRLGLEDFRADIGTIDGVSSVGASVAYVCSSNVRHGSHKE